MKMHHWAVVSLLGAFAFAGCGVEDDALDNDVALDNGVEEVGMVPGPVGEAGAEDGFATWDADRDRRLAGNEFGGWSRGVFSRWNRDADAGLRDTEFAEGVFGLWDRDRDNRLTEVEWNEGVAGWFENNEYGTFADWDANRDMVLDATELGEGFNRTGLFGSWDLNNNDWIEENEWNDGLFAMFDADNDAFVNEAEWGEGTGVWGL